MVPSEMVIDQPPIEVLQKLWGEMGRSPSAASQFGNSLAKREIYSFDERGVYFPAQTDIQQAVAIAFFALPQKSLFDLDLLFSSNWELSCSTAKYGLGRLLKSRSLQI